MTWLLRSAPISFSASRLATACAAGIIFKPGSRAAVTTFCRSIRSNRGTNRNSPAKRVRKERGDRSKRRTSATAAISGFTVKGRSSSARRGRREKPSSRSKRIRELMLMVWPAAASSRCMSYTERLRCAWPRPNLGPGRARERTEVRAAAGGRRKRVFRGGGGTGDRGRERHPPSSRSGGRHRRRLSRRRRRRGGLRTAAARGTGGQGRSSDPAVLLSDSQCWTSYSEDATQTLRSQYVWIEITPVGVK